MHVTKAMFDKKLGKYRIRVVASSVAVNVVSMDMLWRTSCYRLVMSDGRTNIVIITATLTTNPILVFPHYKRGLHVRVTSRIHDTTLLHPIQPPVKMFLAQSSFGRGAPTLAKSLELPNVWLEWHNHWATYEILACNNQLLACSWSRAMAIWCS